MYQNINSGFLDVVDRPQSWPPSFLPVCVCSSVLPEVESFPLPVDRGWPLTCPDQENGTGVKTCQSSAAPQGLQLPRVLCASAAQAGLVSSESLPAGGGAACRGTEASETQAKPSRTSRLSLPSWLQVCRWLQLITIRTAQLRPASVPDQQSYEK